jgi:hypothetical protein
MDGVLIQGRIVKETAKAIQVESMAFYRQLDPQAVFQWLPKSVLTIDRHDNGNVDIILPPWLAREKGL